MGTPARRNVAICREKCMISTSGTRCFVISTFMPLRSTILSTRMP